MSVPLPAPEGPEMTNSRGRRAPGAGSASPEQRDELVTLALGEPAHGLRLADPALVQAARRLDAAELREREQDVEDLRRHQVLGRAREHLSCRDIAGLQFALQPRPLNPYRVRAAQRLHALVERSERCLSRDLLAGRHCRLIVGIPCSAAQAVERNKSAPEQEKREPLVECCCFQCSNTRQAALSEKGDKFLTN